MRLQHYSGLTCLEIRLRNEEASPRFHGLCKQRLAQCPAFCVLNYDQKFWGYIQKIRRGCAASWKPYPISDQNLWFSLPYLRPDNKFDILFQTWRFGVWRMTGAHKKLLQDVQGSWHKHYKGNRLIAKWWRSS